MALASGEAAVAAVRPSPARGGEARLAWRAAFRDVFPVLFAMLPLALAVGMTIAQAAISAGIGWLGAPLVFAGASHLALVSMLGTGVAPLIAVGAALVVNARFAVYGAALAPLFERQPRWFRLVGPHLLVDQTFALVVARTERHEPGWMRTYYLTIGTLLLTLWLAGVAAGIALEPVLPADWPVSAAAPLMVASLLGTALGSPRAIAVAASAFLVGAVLTPVVGATGIILAGGVGVIVGRLPGLPARPARSAGRDL